MDHLNMLSQANKYKDTVPNDDCTPVNRTLSANLSMTGK